ncbi:MAG: hypothetical protein N3I35_11715 [Clostridia bacterium]|nr:hypothetical protein [Clostridia bacterium]
MGFKKVTRKYSSEIGKRRAELACEDLLNTNEDNEDLKHIEIILGENEVILTSSKESYEALGKKYPVFNICRENCTFSRSKGCKNFVTYKINNDEQINRMLRVKRNFYKIKLIWNYVFINYI